MVAEHGRAAFLFTVLHLTRQQPNSSKLNRLALPAAPARKQEYLQMADSITVRNIPITRSLPAECSGTVERAGYFLLKRLLDIFVSFGLLLLFSPLFLLISLLIRIDSPGPAIYSQKRVGCRHSWKGKTLHKEVRQFTFFKFRTMYQNSDDSIHRQFIHAYIHNDLEGMARLQKGTVEQGNEFKLNGDPRITRVGRILRKTSMDELPQFWNVLTGDMSLVGPRPAIPYEVEMYEPWHMTRLSTRPGLTGLWQVTARNSASFDDLVRIDLEYIEKQSFWLDLKILFMTPLAIFDRRGK